MSVISQPKTLFKGEDKTYTLTIVDEDDERVDLTAFSAIELEVKIAAGDADPALIAKAIGSGITLLTQSGSTLGQATVEIDPADTSALAARIYEYDVIAVDGSGERHVVIPPSDFDLREVVNIAP